LSGIVVTVIGHMHRVSLIGTIVFSYPPRGQAPEMPRVLVTPYLLQNRPGPYREILERAGFEVVFPTARLSESVPDAEALLAQLDGVAGVLAGSELYTREVLERARLRAIARMGVGYDAIDVAAATERRIAVTIVPGTNDHSVAELTMTLVLGVFRGFPGRDREVRSGAWRRRVLPRLAGKTMGLVGLGRIGKSVVPRAKALGLSLIACDPCADREFADRYDVRLTSFEELLVEADIVSLHSPCTAETTNLINARTLARMRPGSVLINTARGGLVDEDALAEALSSGHLLGAGLDAFKVEPLPLSSPLLKVDNVLLSPHMGGLDHESERDMGNLAAQCLVDLYQGRWPEACAVNPSLAPGWKW